MGSTPALTPDAHLCRTTGAGMHSLLSYGAGGDGGEEQFPFQQENPTLVHLHCVAVRCTPEADVREG